MSRVVDYVLGFAFDLNTDGVVLIRKTHPDWQAGKLNGVGGHRKKDETAHAAMVREFEEETGVRTHTSQWRLAGHMRKNGSWHCSVFTCKESFEGRVRTTTDEEVVMANRKHFDFQAMPPLAFACVSNVRALVELCRLRPDRDEALPMFALDYT